LSVFQVTMRMRDRSLSALERNCGDVSVQAA
jgi:hypothetical protein